MAGTPTSAPGQGPPPPADPDARGTAPAARHRLNVIEQITAGAVASDYADAVSDPSPTSRRERVLVAALALGVAGFVLAMGVSARVINAPVVDDQKRALLERISEADASREALTEELAGLRDEVEVAQAAQLDNIQGGIALSQDIQEHELVTGYIAVDGPAVVVTLSDAPTGSEEDPEDIERVLDSDVQRAVNGLWAAGAEAIAVNKQRISTRTAIRSAADAILVNYRPLQPPYRVEAIGDPDTLESRFLATQDAAELRGVSEQFGIGFTTESVDAVRLPAATLALPENAEIVEPGKGEGQ